jgi:hypothetical protein
MSEYAPRFSGMAFKLSCREIILPRSSYLVLQQVSITFPPFLVLIISAGARYSELSAVDARLRGYFTRQGLVAESNQACDIAGDYYTTATGSY